MRFKKGDTVYAISPSDKIFRATIKCVHRSDPALPYELDITARNRFYPEDGVFVTREEAEDAYNKALAAKMADAVESGKEFQTTRKIEPDADGVLRDRNGKELTKYFKLPQEQKKKLEELCSAVDTFCSENNIPYILTVIAESRKVKGGAQLLTRNSSCFPGPRCPDWLSVLWDIQSDMMYGDNDK